MAEESDKFIWLLIQETIGHHESAKKCQQLIQELMWERGRIELAYIQNLEKWAETLTHGIKGEDSPYSRHVQEVLSLPAREAHAQANQHQQVYNDILRADGPCLQMRKLLQSIEETTMVSESNRVYSTAVSQYQAIVQRRQELEGEVRRKKQHYDYSLSASRDMDDKLDGRRRRKTTRPMSARKMETMESRRYHLKKYSDVQLNQLRDQEVDLDLFMKDQKKPLESILSDLNLFSRRRLSDTVGLTQAYLQTLAQQEADENRKRKRLTLLECENVMDSQPVTSLADQMIITLTEKVKQMILAQNTVRFTLEDFVCGCDGKKQSILPPASGGPPVPPPAPGPDTFRFRPSAPSPDSLQNRLRSGVSEGEIPIPPPANYGRSQIARVSHLLQVQSLQDELYRSAVGRDPDVIPSPSTGTMQVFYTSSSDSLLAKAGSAQPTASNSVGSEGSVETLVIPPERKTLPRDQLPFVVRDFCTQEEEEDEEGEPDLSPRSELCKKILKREYSGDSDVTVTEVVELIPGQLTQELVEENASVTGTDDTVRSPRSLQSSPGVLPVASSSSSNNASNDGEDVTMMTNIRVRALHNYYARNVKELSLEKGQIVKQKRGADDSGFSYGWTRSYKLGPKHYGYYPSGMVEFLPLYIDGIRQYTGFDLKAIQREMNAVCVVKR